MRLLTAGSLVRAQLEEPKQKGHQKMSCLFCFLKFSTNQQLTAVNALRSKLLPRDKATDRRRWRMKGGSFGAGTGVMRTRVSRTTKVPNRRFEANLRSQEKNLFLFLAVIICHSAKNVFFHLHALIGGKVFGYELAFGILVAPNVPPNVDVLLSCK